MPIFPCRLFQPLHLGDYFTITLVAIKENAVDLHIASGKGNRVVRAVQLLQLLDEARAQEDNPTPHTSTLLSPLK